VITQAAHFAVRSNDTALVRTLVSHAEKSGEDTGSLLVSRASPSWNRSILTEIYLCHACCSDHETEDGNGPGRGLPTPGAGCRCTTRRGRVPCR
jgi:hypothetical protein